MKASASSAARASAVPAAEIATRAASVNKKAASPAAADARPAPPTASPAAEPTLETKTKVTKALTKPAETPPAPIAAVKPAVKPAVKTPAAKAAAAREPAAKVVVVAESAVKPVVVKAPVAKVEPAVTQGMAEAQEIIAPSPVVAQVVAPVAVAPVAAAPVAVAPVAVTPVAVARVAVAPEAARPAPRPQDMRPGHMTMQNGRPVPPSRAAAKEEIFVDGDFVVYPTHGVGKVEKIAVEEIAGHKLELIHITFEENRMTLRVPVAKARTAGLRKLATRKLFDEALAVLKGRARIKRTMWSRRAQEYEAKINSGDPIAIAEVVRDLHRNSGQPDQSFSERQIYEAALDRLAAELAALDETDKMTAIIKLGNFLKTV